MTGNAKSMAVKGVHFLWQHLLLLISLNLMTLGVALCVRSNLGSGVISALPMAFSLAGTESLMPALTIGEYTNIMNIFFVSLQVVLLRRKFQPVQLFQILVGFVFGLLIDMNMGLISGIDFETLPNQIAAQIIGCTILGIGISAEIRCGSITMPGEGIQIAISRLSGMSFGKTKIIVDCALVGLTVAASFLFWGTWRWAIIGPGTLFAMIYIGWFVKKMSPRMGWFDRLLGADRGMGRYIYGLLRLKKSSEKSEKDLVE